MNELIRLFADHLSAEEKSENTTGHYVEVLERFEKWLLETHGIPLTPADTGRITGLIMVEYYQTFHRQGLKPATRNNYVVILKKFFSFLSETGMLAETPTLALHCIKKKKRPSNGEKEVYSTDQLKAFLDSTGKPPFHRNDLRDTAVVALILGSGMRASEVCGLNVSAKDGIRSGVLCCKRKGGNWEEVTVASFVYEHVARYLLTRSLCKPEDPLFVSQKGQRLTRNALWKSLAAKQRNLDLPTGIHSFRHTFLSDIDHNSKGGAALARDLGGHSSIAITNAYLHTSLEERKNAVDHVSYTGLFSE